MAKIEAKGMSRTKHHKHFCLGVSMGSQNHEGESLEATINWINQSHFEEGIIDVSDTLYRHTYIAQGMSEHEAMSKARQDGNEWVERNQGIIKKLKIPTKIIRWDSWIKHSQFHDYKYYFLSLYKNHPLFKQAIDQDIDCYYHRKKGVSIRFYSTTTHKHSVNYFCEELSAHSILFNEYPSVSLYAGKQLESYKLIREGKIKVLFDGIKESPYVRLCLYGFESTIQKKAA